MRQEERSGGRKQKDTTDLVEFLQILDCHEGELLVKLLGTMIQIIQLRTACRLSG